MVSWTWSGPNPDTWGSYLAGDVVPGDEIRVQGGTARSDDTSYGIGDHAVVRGLNSAGDTFQTPASNTVVVT